MNRLWEWISTLRCTTPEFANNWENAIKQSWKTLKIWDIRLYQIFELLEKFQPKITSEEFSPKKQNQCSKFCALFEQWFCFLWWELLGCYFLLKFCKKLKQLNIIFVSKFQILWICFITFFSFFEIGCTTLESCHTFLYVSWFCVLCLGSFFTMQCKVLSFSSCTPSLSVSSVAYYNIWQQVCVVLVSMGWHSTADYG